MAYSCPPPVQDPYRPAHCAARPPRLHFHGLAADSARMGSRRLLLGTVGDRVVLNAPHPAHDHRATCKPPVTTVAMALVTLVIEAVSGPGRHRRPGRRTGPSTPPTRPRRTTRRSPTSQVDDSARRVRGSGRRATSGSDAGRHPARHFRGDAADDRQRAVPQHAVQPRRRARRRDGRQKCGLRSEGLRRTASRRTAPGSCIAASPRGATAASSASSSTAARRLICLDAATGTPVETFGDARHRRSQQGLVWRDPQAHYTNTSPPVVYKNLVILGNGVGDRLTYHHDPPGDVRAFDARTGKQVWSFHTIPQRASSATTRGATTRGSSPGHTNVWAPMTLDAARGLVYLPVSTPSNDFFGGATAWRESLRRVARLSRRRDRRSASGTSRSCTTDCGTTIRRRRRTWSRSRSTAGRSTRVVQLTKQGFAFVFDRVTGKPVWPIEERPVPPSDVAGRARVADAAVSDQAAGVHAAGRHARRRVRSDAGAEGGGAGGAEEIPARAAATRRRRLQGTFSGRASSAARTGAAAAFDPDTGMLYVKTSNSPAVLRIVPARRRTAARRVDAEFAGAQANATFAPPAAGGAGAGCRSGGGRRARRCAVCRSSSRPTAMSSAIDLNTGTIAWREPFGDIAVDAQQSGARRRDAARRARRRRRDGRHRHEGRPRDRLVGGDDNALHALDATTGREILERSSCRDAPSATPMTYRTPAGHQFLVIATGSGANAELVALRVNHSGSNFTRSRFTRQKCRALAGKLPARQTCRDDHCAPPPMSFSTS